jgi:nucleoside phosphorylase
MAERPQSFDICIICALYEEATAVIDEFQSRCAISFSKAFSQLYRYEYRWSVMQNSSGESLTILVTWLSNNGPVSTASDLWPLLHEFHPRFAAMAGFCAGYREKVHLGDLVVAEYAYHYEEGKIRSGLDGKQQRQPEMKTAHPTNQVIQYAEGFDGWREPVSELERRLLNDSEQPERHIAPIASGMAVHADNPFPWLIEYLNRKTLALDMEAAAFYRVLCAFPQTQSLVVKGVCDYADVQKNDSYHNYAARASGVYLLYFIQEYVTDQTMPRQHIPAQTGPKSKPTSIRVLSRPSREGNKAIILFVLDGIEHALEYIRYDKISRQILFLKEKQQELVRLVVPFATLRPLVKHATFQIDGVDGLLTFKMSAVISIMTIKVEVGGVEVFHN